MGSRKKGGDSAKATPATAEEVQATVASLRDPYALSSPACTAANTCRPSVGVARGRSPPRLSRREGGVSAAEAAAARLRRRHAPAPPLLCVDFVALSPSLHQNLVAQPLSEQLCDRGA